MAKRQSKTESLARRLYNAHQRAVFRQQFPIAPFSLMADPLLAAYGMPWEIVHCETRELWRATARYFVRDGKK